MNIPSVSQTSVSSLRPGSRRWLSALGFVSLLGVGSSLFAQDPAAGERERRRATENGGERGERRALNPQDMQERMMSSLRERLEIKDDEEWKLISERISKVMELRRTAAPAGGGAFIGAFAGRGPGGPGGPGGDRGNGGERGRGGRGPGGANPEMTALSSALRDKLPDAEIKSRLDRVREMRRDNEARLSKAQEDLRAVLSVRQEATAVVFGLLP